MQGKSPRSAFDPLCWQAPILLCGAIGAVPFHLGFSILLYFGAIKPLLLEPLIDFGLGTVLASILFAKGVKSLFLAERLGALVHPQVPPDEIQAWEHILQRYLYWRLHRLGPTLSSERGELHLSLVLARRRSPFDGGESAQTEPDVHLVISKSGTSFDAPEDRAILDRLLAGRGLARVARIKSTSKPRRDPTRDIVTLCVLHAHIDHPFSGHERLGLEDEFSYLAEKIEA